MLEFLRAEAAWDKLSSVNANKGFSATCIWEQLTEAKRAVVLRYQTSLT
jgi:hypothetical protein